MTHTPVQSVRDGGVTLTDSQDAVDHLTYVMAQGTKGCVIGP
jgi:hypothetical protein